jgi:hypothetical protein
VTLLALPLADAFGNALWAGPGRAATTGPCGSGTGLRTAARTWTSSSTLRSSQPPIYIYIYIYIYETESDRHDLIGTEFHRYMDRAIYIYIYYAQLYIYIYTMHSYKVEVCM